MAKKNPDIGKGAMRNFVAAIIFVASVSIAPFISTSVFAAGSLSTNELASLSAHVYEPDSRPPTGFRIESIHPGGHGFYAVVYCRNKPCSKPIIAYRGTDDFYDPGKGLDSRTYGQIITGDGTSESALREQLDSADRLADEIIQKYGGANVVVTGHSLGGGLSQVVGARTGVRTETFNAPPMARVAQNRFQSERSGWRGGINAENVVNHRREGDLISNPKDLIGGHVDATKDYNSITVKNGESAHSIEAFLRDYFQTTDQRALEANVIVNEKSDQTRDYINAFQTQVAAMEAMQDWTCRNSATNNVMKKGLSNMCAMGQNSLNEIQSSLAEATLVGPQQASTKLLKSEFDEAEFYLPQCVGQVKQMRMVVGQPSMPPGGHLVVQKFETHCRAIENFLAKRRAQVFRRN